MGVEFATKGKEKGHVHYVNVPVSYAVEENFGGDPDVSAVLAFAEEDLEIQECVYQSLQNNTRNGNNYASSSSGSRSCDSHESIGQNISSIITRFDEVLARQLQKEMESDSTTIASSAATTTVETSTTPTPSVVTDNVRNSARTSQVRWDDGINPDDMSYEELQQLGERIGSESRGLSDEVISYLTVWKYKRGLFSKKEKLECTICSMEYKYREKIMTLPCKHHYHKDCIAKWLKENKTCPICMKEVFGS